MNNKLKVLTLFAGYGGDKFALKKAGIDYECVGFSEIDKYAIQCHKQNHEGKDLGDITKINPNDLGDIDLITGGFPCQSFSTAGKGQGVDDEKGRGLLFNEIIRIAEVKKPKYMLLENVKGLMSKKHKEFFEFTKQELKRIGYNIDVSLYNSKKYGTPQNRERVFYVCIRNDLEFNYIRPQEQELTIFLKDVLEDEVDEKYYLSEKSLKHLQRDFGSKGKCLDGLNTVPTLTTAMGPGGGNVPYFDESKLVTPQTSYCLDANYAKGTNLKGYLEKHRRQLVFERCPIKEYTNFFIFPRAKDGELVNGSYNRVWHKDYCGTLNCIHPLNILDNTMKIRKLTPKECFRLMGFTEDQINLEGLSNTQRYKLAGNGWEINLVSQIFLGFIKRIKYYEVNKK